MSGVNWKRVTGAAVVSVVALAAGGCLGLLALVREDRAVDDGVVEFKTGNYESGVRALTPYADRGNTAAELTLGMAYAFGLGVNRDRERAHALLRASLGPEAQKTYLWVARSFDTGDGVAKDAQEAIAWYRIAANDGSGEARDHLKSIGTSRTVPMP